MLHPAAHVVLTHHTRYADFIGKLENLFGPALHINSLDAQEVNFQVRGLTNELVIRQMMMYKSELFGAGVDAGGSCVLGPADFQILCPLETQAGVGITVSYLPNIPDRANYLSGFWYY